MDKFAISSIVIAVIIEGFLVWGRYHNPNEKTSNLVLASFLPLILIGTVVLTYYLQRGET